MTKKEVEKIMSDYLFKNVYIPMLVGLIVSTIIFFVLY